MPTNKYCNLYGENKIKDDYTKINDGFSGVETDIADVLNSEEGREAAETQREINEVNRQLRYSNTKHYAEYDADTIYHTNNIVSLQGSSFMLKENSDGSIMESQGYAPPDYPQNENDRWKMVGKKGDKGDTGAVPNIQVGTVTTLQPGNPVTVTRQSGSPDTAPVFNFGIPKGADGTGVGDMLKTDYDSNDDGKVNSADIADTLQGLTASINELNYSDGLTGAIQSQLNNKAALVHNHDSAYAAKSLETTVNTHLSDYVRQPGAGTTTGSANIYSLTLSPIPAAYVDGMGIVTKIHVDSTAASTINVNGLGAKPLKKANGNDVTNLKSGGIYTFRYNATAGNFILQGEGGEYGNVTAADVQSGVTFGTETGLQTGTNTNKKYYTITSSLTPDANSKLTISGLPFTPSRAIITMAVGGARGVYIYSSANDLRDTYNGCRINYYVPSVDMLNVLTNSGGVFAFYALAGTAAHTCTAYFYE